MKGIWQTAPYLHDGRAATLLEIFTTYTKDKMGIVSNLTDVELNQMVRYLQELDDVPETVVPDQPAPVDPMDPMSPMGMSSSSSACAMPRALATSSLGSGAWAVLVAMLGVAALRRRR